MSRRYWNLQDFFLGYFHPDWRLDAANEAEVVADYASHTAVDTMQGVVSDLRELLAEPLDEQALHDMVLEKYTLFHDPWQAGSTMRAWLTGLLTELEQHVASG